MGLRRIFLFPENFLHLQIFMIIFVGGIVAGAVALYSPTNEYLQNIIVALLPLAGQFFYHADVYNITVGSLLVMYGAIMALSDGTFIRPTPNSSPCVLKDKTLLKILKGR